MSPPRRDPNEGQAPWYDGRPTEDPDVDPRRRPPALPPSRPGPSGGWPPAQRTGDQRRFPSDDPRAGYPPPGGRRTGAPTSGPGYGAEPPRDPHRPDERARGRRGGSGYGGPTASGGHDAPGYGTPPGPGYGAPASGPGYGAPASGPGYGAPASGPGYGTPASGPGYGAPSSGGYDRPNYGDYDAPNHGGAHRGGYDAAYGPPPAGYAGPPGYIPPTSAPGYGARPDSARPDSARPSATYGPGRPAGYDPGRPAGYDPGYDPARGPVSGAGYGRGPGDGRYGPGDPDQPPTAYADPTSAFRPRTPRPPADYSERTVRGGGGFGPAYDPTADDGYDAYPPAEAYQPSRYADQDPRRANGPRPPAPDHDDRDLDDEDADETDEPTPPFKDPLLIAALVCAVLGIAPVAIGLGIVALRRYATVKAARAAAIGAIALSVVWGPVLGVYAMKSLGSSSPSGHAVPARSPSASGSSGSAGLPVPSLEPGCAAGETAVSDLYAKLKVDPPAKVEGDFKEASADLLLAARKTANAKGADAMRAMSADLDLLVAALDAGDPTTDLVSKVDKDGQAITAACAPGTAK